VKFFLFAQSRVFQSPFPGGQRAAMGAVNLPVPVQNLQVLANRNLGCIEMPGEFGNQHASLAGEQFEYGAAAFFVKHC
jgi:hypothetical protein